MERDSPLKWVRRNVFNATQEELAEIVGVSRIRVLRYESGERPPYEFLRSIRDAARERALPFDADWLFEIPARLPSSCAVAAERVPGDVQ